MQNKVSDIFDDCNHDDCKLIHELSLLTENHGDAVYREALLRLVGKDFNNETARRYWDEALAHREKILISNRVDNSLRPALLDYLYQVVHELVDPRIVEAVDLDNIKNASVTDGLTGLYNQTYFKAFMEKLCGQRQTDNTTSYAVLLLDLDHFKQYNDRYGHLPGDKALQQVAKILQQCIRKGDVAARYGGEEFAILLSQVTQSQAYSISERIRKEVAKADFPGRDPLEQGELTISGGLAFMSNTDEKAEALIQRADEELYRAKLFRNVISPHQSENRKSARIQRQSIVELALFDEATFLPVLSHDVSPSGISLDCDRQLEAGTSVKLLFRHPYWPSNRQVVASVLRVEEQAANGLYRLGLKFNPEQALSCRDSVLQDTA